MPIFYFRAVNAAGEIIQGSLEAKGDQAVVQQLHQNKLIPLNISQDEPTSAGTSLWPPSFLRKVGLSDIVQFSQEMAVLLNAGLPLDRSLQIILEVTKKPVLRTMIQQLWRDMQAGKALSEALSRQRVFSSLYISLVKAGETGGFLEITFQRLAGISDRPQGTEKSCHYCSDLSYDSRPRGWVVHYSDADFCRPEI